MVTWTHPHFLPDSYTVSYSCQLLCDPQTPSVKTNTVTGTANNHTISSLNPGSSCTVNVTAVFVDGNSNTLSSSTNTSTAGIQLTHQWYLTSVHELYMSWYPVPTGAPGGISSASVESRSLSVVWEMVPCPLPAGRSHHWIQTTLQQWYLHCEHYRRGDQLCIDWTDSIHWLLCASGSSQWWRYWTIQ